MKAKTALIRDIFNFEHGKIFNTASLTKESVKIGQISRFYKLDSSLMTNSKLILFLNIHTGICLDLMSSRSFVGFFKIMRYKLSRLAPKKGVVQSTNTMMAISYKGYNGTQHQRNIFKNHMMKMVVVCVRRLYKRLAVRYWSSRGICERNQKLGLNNPLLRIIFNFLGV